MNKRLLSFRTWIKWLWHGKYSWLMCPVCRSTVEKPMVVCHHCGTVMKGVNCYGECWW